MAMTRPSRVPGAAWSERDHIAKLGLELAAAERAVIEEAIRWAARSKKGLAGQYLMDVVDKLLRLRAAQGTTTEN